MIVQIEPLATDQSNKIMVIVSPPKIMGANV